MSLTFCFKSLRFVRVRIRVSFSLEKLEMDDVCCGLIWTGKWSKKRKRKKKRKRRIFVWVLLDFILLLVWWGNWSMSPDSSRSPPRSRRFRSERERPSYRDAPYSRERRNFRLVCLFLLSCLYLVIWNYVKFIYAIISLSIPLLYLLSFHIKSNYTAWFVFNIICYHIIISVCAYARIIFVFVTVYINTHCRYEIHTQTHTWSSQMCTHTLTRDYIFGYICWILM